MGDQTSLVSRQEREANAKNQPMFRKRLFKDILIAISGSFRTGTSNTGCCMMSSPWLPFTLTIGKLRKRAQQNIPEDNVLPPSWHVTHADVHTHYIAIQSGVMCTRKDAPSRIYTSTQNILACCSCGQQIAVTCYANINLNALSNITWHN